MGERSASGNSRRYFKEFCKLISSSSPKRRTHTALVGVLHRQACTSGYASITHGNFRPGAKKMFYKCFKCVTVGLSLLVAREHVAEEYEHRRGTPRIPETVATNVILMDNSDIPGTSLDNL